MSYIAPNSIIKLYKGVPLDNRYVNTFHGTNETFNYQLNTFYYPITYIAQSYVRHTRNSIRLSASADVVEQYNYMSFQNTSYGDQWFYAFILSVDYVNNSTCVITYEIDVLSTWRNAYNLGKCFVEREHTVTDELGENLVDEGFTCNPAYINNEQVIGFNDGNYNNDSVCVIYYAPNLNKKVITNITYNSRGLIESYTLRDTKIIVGSGYTVNGLKLNNGVFAGVVNVGVEVNPSTNSLTKDEDASNVYRTIQTILSDEVGGNIVYIQQIPKSIYTSSTFSGVYTQTDYTILEKTTFTTPHTLTTYRPKNKKLYASPYRQIEVITPGGQKGIYYWERFNDTLGADEYYMAKFSKAGTGFPQAQIQFIPQEYNGRSNDYSSQLVFDGFLSCAWSEDSYQKWLLNNKISLDASFWSSLALTGISGALAPLTGGATVPTLISGGISSISSLLNIATQHEAAKNQQATVNGNGASSSAMYWQNRFGFVVRDVGISAEQAKIIDDYFTMYGYSVMEVKTPNIFIGGQTNVRPHWNYLKTNNAVVIANSGMGVPTGDATKISEIYDKGITVWSNLRNIGNYTLDNSPVAQG